MRESRVLHASGAPRSALPRGASGRRGLERPAASWARARSGSIPAIVVLVLGLAGPTPAQDVDRRGVREQQAAAAEAAAEAAVADADTIVGLLGDPSPWVRDAAFGAVVARHDVALRDDLTAALPRAPLAVAPALAELLGACGHAPARVTLEAALERAPEPVALEALWALEALADPASGPALARAHARRREPRVRGDALIALAKVDPTTARDLARRAVAAEADEPLVIAGLEALAIAAPADASRAATAVVRSPRTGGRALRAALDVLGAIASAPASAQGPDAALEDARASVDALVERLPGERGLARFEVARALTSITGAGAQDDDRAWASWWSARRADWRPPARVEGQGEGEPRPGATTTRPRFHGLEVVSERVLFLQDVSGGMNDPIAARPGSPTQLLLARDELTAVIDALDGDVRADVAFFATGARRAVGRLVQLDRGRALLRDAVVKGARTPQGTGQARSNLYDVLASALEDPEVDTVYFMTEGGATEGRYVDTDRLVRHLARLATYRRVRVHGLALARGAGTRLVREVAEVTGGTFRDLTRESVRGP